MEMNSEHESGSIPLSKLVDLVTGKLTRDEANELFAQIDKDERASKDLEFVIEVLNAIHSECRPDNQ